ncbi:MAG TPA: hypothetical protein VEK07_18445 [Polyangiaceae bacterium]|nr:hypothetical protein [Polyangiaceae bacterium]
MTDERAPTTPPTMNANHSKRRPRTVYRPAHAYQSLDDAAPRLGMTVQALRARCRRGVAPDGRCHLGDGVVAMKFGRTWRVRFPT